MLAKKGQVTLLVLLLSLLGLTVGVSVATRSLSDLRQATVADQGTKALAAAEAAAQFGLSQVTSGAISLPDPGECRNVTAVTGLSLGGIAADDSDVTKTGLTYQVCSSQLGYAGLANVVQGDVFQVDLSQINSANVKKLTVLWKNPNAAVEIVKLSKSGSGYTVARYPYNGTAITSYATNNSFAPAMNGSFCVSATCGDASYNSGSCTGVGEFDFDKNNDVLLRVRPVYASTDVAICGASAGNSPERLDVKSFSVTGVARTTGNVVKKIQITQLDSTIPTLFDNVFFSGGSIAK